MLLDGREGGREGWKEGWKEGERRKVKEEGLTASSASSIDENALVHGIPVKLLLL